MILSSLRNIDKDFLHPEISSKTSFFCKCYSKVGKIEIAKITKSRFQRPAYSKTNICLT